MTLIKLAVSSIPFISLIMIAAAFLMPVRSERDGHVAILLLVSGQVIFMAWGLSFMIG